MQAIALLSMSFAIAALLGSTAIVTIQNAEPVSLKFMVWQSVPIPLGLVLSFCVIVGLLGTTLTLALLTARR